MKTKFLGFLAVALSAGFVACNNSSDTSSTTTDSTTNTTMTSTTDSTAPADNTATTTTTSMNNYTALADTFRVNSEAGNYLDPRTGKSFKIRVDTATGTRLNATTNEPVWRYVDKRTYKVYSGDDNNSMWDTVGTARMQSGRLEYEGDNNTWTSYDKRWKDVDEKRAKDYKTRIGDTKIKVGADGDIKVKDLNTGEKTKYDAQTDRVKHKGGDKSGADSAQ